MKTNLEKIGKVLGKEAQKKIKGGIGGLSVCQDYHGPYSFDANSCEDYYQIPDKFKVCVLVAWECL